MTGERDTICSAILSTTLLSCVCGDSQKEHEAAESSSEEVEAEGVAFEEPPPESSVGRPESSDLVSPHSQPAKHPSNFNKATFCTPRDRQS